MNCSQSLLDSLCPNDIQYSPLIELVPISRGVRLTRNQLLGEGAYPVYQNSLSPLGYNGDYNCPRDTTFIISAGAAGEIGYSENNFWAADDCIYFDCSNGVLISRYLYHVLLSKQPQIMSKVRKASIPRLSRKDIEKIVIPVPPLPIQEEIVRILDTFTELTAELTLRKKQYEFYRDKLLSFDDLSEEERERGSE